MHSNVHVGKHAQIGSFVWLYPYVVITNDPHPPSNVQLGAVVEDFAVIATMSVVLPGVRVSRHSVVGAHSRLSNDTEEGFLYSGNPAKKICAASRVRLKDGSRRSAYPWTTHFKHGYPNEITANWGQP
jgi:acetyltransferase-like isoleucine patch superfamily enzyme